VGTRGAWAATCVLGKHQRTRGARSCLSVGHTPAPRGAWAACQGWAPRSTHVALGLR